MDIEKELFPNSGKLIVNEDTITAQIIDAELDPINVAFNNDYCAELNTNNLTYVTLTRENLCNLLDMLDESEAKFKEILK